MIALLCIFLALFASLFKSNSRLEAENAALRHQLIVLQRRVTGRVRLTNGDRLFLVMLYRWFPSILVRTENLIRVMALGILALSGPIMRSFSVQDALERNACGRCSRLKTWTRCV